jgi:flagellar biosynthetic protein FliR
MLNSYALLPIGSILQVEILYSAIFGASNTMFQNAVLIMLPIVGYILLINLVVGVITRSAPQLNLFSFGFPITILSTIVILFFSISPLANMLVDIVADHADVLADLILELSNGRE